MHSGADWVSVLAMSLETFQLFVDIVSVCIHGSLIIGSQS